MLLNTYMDLYVRPLAGVVGVYGLYEPRSSTPKYVGKTTCVWSRYKSHILSRDTSAKSLWVQSLKDRGEYPTIQVLEECLETSLDEREKYWIDHYFGKGEETVNTTNAKRIAHGTSKIQVALGSDTGLALQSISLLNGVTMSDFVESAVWDYILNSDDHTRSALAGIFTKRDMDFDAILKARTGK